MASTSFIQPAAIKVIAQSVDVTYLTDEAAKALAPDVEYRLREVIQDALKFARHSKRTKLSTEDVSNALRLRNIEPVYGFLGNSDPAKFVRATAYPDVYFLRDDTVPLEQITCAALPQAPHATTVMPHWLFIDGVQPQTEENAAVDPRPAAKRPRLAATAAAAGTGAAGTTGAAAAGQEGALAKRRAGQEAGGAEAGAAAAAGPAGGGGGGGERVAMPVQHILSDEMQRLLQQIKQTLGSPSPATLDAGADEAGEGGLWGAVSEPEGAERGAATNGSGLLLTPMQRAVLTSMQKDPGMQQLLPYLCQHVGQEVKDGLRQLPRLHMVLRLLQSLLLNPAVALEPYLHTLMPTLLTCLMAKSLGNGPSCDHWALRDAAADLVARICGRFGEPYYGLQVRIAKQLLRALLDGSKPLPSHYGAVAGLAALGPATVRLLLLPQLEPYLARLQPSLEGGREGRKEGVRQFEATKVYGALLQAAGSAMYDRLMAAAADDLPAYLFRAAARARRNVAALQGSTSPLPPSAAAAKAEPAVPALVSVAPPPPNPKLEALWANLNGQHHSQLVALHSSILAAPTAPSSVQQMEQLCTVSKNPEHKLRPTVEVLLYMLAKQGVGPPSVAAEQAKAAAAAAAAAAPPPRPASPQQDSEALVRRANGGGSAGGAAAFGQNGAGGAVGRHGSGSGGGAAQNGVMVVCGGEQPAVNADVALQAGPSLARAAVLNGTPARSPRAILAESWREDADLGEVVWALTSLFGPAFLARMPAPPALAELNI